MSDVRNLTQSELTPERMEEALRSCFPKEWINPWWFFWQLSTCALPIPGIGQMLIMKREPLELDNGYGEIHLHFMPVNEPAVDPEDIRMFRVSGWLTSYHQIEFDSWASVEEIRAVTKTRTVYKNVEEEYEDYEPV